MIMKDFIQLLCQELVRYLYFTNLYFTKRVVIKTSFVFLLFLYITSQFCNCWPTLMQWALFPRSHFKLVCCRCPQPFPCRQHCPEGKCTFLHKNLDGVFLCVRWSGCAFIDACVWVHTFMGR